jgi:hypothetical protein
VDKVSEARHPKDLVMRLATCSGLVALGLGWCGLGCSGSDSGRSATAAGAGGAAGAQAGSASGSGGAQAVTASGATSVVGGTAGVAGGGTANGGGGGVLGGSGGALATAGSAGAPAAGAENRVEPGATKERETKLSDQGLTLVSYGGYLNGESFQQEGVISYKGYQYAAYWNTARHVVLARRKLPDAAWASLELSDYTNREDDAHNTISLGISEADGSLHLAFDHHSSPLHYRRSVPDLVSDAEGASWSAASFGAVTSSLVSGQNIADLTYPRFVSEPGGAKLLFSARIGTSGSGDEYLWEYDAATQRWSLLGKYLDGIVDNVNAYPHGLSYGPGSQRLHLAWCWRDTSNASTNHDLLYLYSDDHGRTWHDDAGATVATTGSQAARQSTPGIRVWDIGQNRGLINQEHMVVDSLGRVHVLLSHLPDGQADDSNFDSARGKTQYFHYLRKLDGKWTRTALGQPSVHNFRGKLALSSTNNLYAVLPDLRIAAAPADGEFANWTLLEKGQPNYFFSDPLIDSVRLQSEDTLSVMYPQKASPNIYVIDYSLE